jgi:predicted outer membrane repeat protein
MPVRQRAWHLTALASLLAAVVGGPLPAAAAPAAMVSASFVVNTLGDSNDLNLGDPACADLVGDCSFRAAVQQANASAGADSITFGVTGTITLSSQMPLITDTLSIVGPGPALVTINADATGPVLAISSANPAHAFVVSGLTLTGGMNDEGGGLNFSGGGSLLIQDAVITDNWAESGGGLYVTRPTTLLSSVVRQNHASTSGGGIYSTAALTVVDSRIEENAMDPTVVAYQAQAPNLYGGGGLYATGPLTLTTSLVLSNTAKAPVFAADLAPASMAPAAPAGPFGAGVYFYGSSGLIEASVIAGNHFIGCVSCGPVASGGGPVSTDGFGGGVCLVNGTLIIQDSQVLNNGAQSGGGLMTGSGLLSLQRVQVTGNSADEGGGIHSYATNLFLSESTVSDNRAIAGNGGGLYVANGTADFTLSYIIENNALGHGGGLYAQASHVTLGYSQIQGNASGQGVPVASGVAGAEPQIASDVGGGLVNAAGSVDVYNSAIVSNTATLGGGLVNGGWLSVINSTISSNQARRDGGGLLMVLVPAVPASEAAWAAGGATLTSTADLLHVTLAGNVADADSNGSGDGGGLFMTVGTTATLHSTVLANSDLGNQAPDCSGTVLTAGYNLVQSTTGCTITATTGDQFNVAAGVQPLQRNGGATLTNGLLLNSLARDTADPAACLPQDQRDVLRPAGAGCDIGAFELAGLFLPFLLR